MKLYDFDGIVFDLDGVLIDSRPVMEQVFTECYRQFGPATDPPLEAFFARMGMPLPDILRELGLPQEMSATYREMSRRMYKQIRIVPGTLSMLTLLRDLAMPVGLMTGKDRVRTLEILTHFDLSHFFTDIVCGDDPFPGKPNPQGLFALATSLGVSPNRLVMIGDSVLDVRCGLAAGALTVAVNWGFESAQTMAKSGAHVCASSFEALESWLVSCRGRFCSDSIMDYQANAAD